MPKTVSSIVLAVFFLVFLMACILAGRLADYLVQGYTAKAIVASLFGLLIGWFGSRYIIRNYDISVSRKD